MAFRGVPQRTEIENLDEYQTLGRELIAFIAHTGPEGRAYEADLLDAWGHDGSPFAGIVSIVLNLDLQVPASLLARFEALAAESGLLDEDLSDLFEHQATLT